MKKLIALLVAVLFAVSMTGLCFAQAEKATPAVPAKADDKAVKADDKKVDKKKDARRTPRRRLTRRTPRRRPPRKTPRRPRRKTRRQQLRQHRLSPQRSNSAFSYRKKKKGIERCPFSFWVPPPFSKTPLYIIVS